MKQINTAQRINLAKLVLMVNRWEILNKKLGNVKSFKIETNPIHESDNSIQPSVVPSNSKESFVSERQQWVQELSRLTSELADAVRAFGVFFKPGAGDECAAAVAILLFGNTDTILPGGYAGEEM